MQNEKAALAEACRILKEGGILLLSEPNDDSLLLRVPRKLANRFTKRFGNDHKAFRSKPWLATIESAGFEVIDDGKGGKIFRRDTGRATAEEIKGSLLEWSKREAIRTDGDWSWKVGKGARIRVMRSGDVRTHSAPEEITER